VSYIFLIHFAPNVGWRLAFLLGPVLAIFVIIVGRVLPESPRWLVTHARRRGIKADESGSRRNAAAPLASVNAIGQYRIAAGTRLADTDLARTNVLYCQFATDTAISGAFLILTRPAAEQYRFNPPNGGRVSSWVKDKQCFADIRPVCPQDGVQKMLKGRRSDA